MWLLGPIFAAGTLIHSGQQPGVHHPASEITVIPSGRNPPPIHVPSVLAAPVFSKIENTGLTDGRTEKGFGIFRGGASAILKIDDLYYVWFRRLERAPGESYADYFETEGKMQIWLATSPDGYQWTERGSVLSSVHMGQNKWYLRFTTAPFVVAENGRYYMFFTAMAGKRIALAVADKPEGPFVPQEYPVLSPSENTEAFDSVVVHDPLVLKRNNQYWLYYKGKKRGQSTHETQIGVAFADRIEGPYRRYADNPLTKSHTTTLWPYREGVVILTDHPKHRTLEFAADGLNFVICADNFDFPAAMDAGAYAPDNGGVAWGLAGTRCLWRWESNLRAADSP